MEGCLALFYKSTRKKKIRYDWPGEEKQQETEAGEAGSSARGREASEGAKLENHPKKKTTPKKNSPQPERGLLSSEELMVSTNLGLR